jgi:predicted dehydrogenase
MLTERPGNVVVIAGRNRGKIDAILASLKAGLHVLADKPWIIDVADLPKLTEALETAQRRSLIALDIMTERWEVTTQLQRELIQSANVFGTLDRGSEDHPAVWMESEHFLSKSVAGLPLRRPWWFFDVEQQGEGLTDVGTHLVDLVPWLLFPGEPIACKDIRLLRAARMPTTLSRSDYQQVTGELDFPAALEKHIASSHLLYFCNTTIAYTLRGVHVWLHVIWGFEARPGHGDRHLAKIRGTRSSIEVRHDEAMPSIPDVYVVPRQSADRLGVKQALTHRLEQLRPRYPHVGFEEAHGEFRLTIPDRLRVGHEAHFGEVMRLFLDYLDDPARLPGWEKANMLAKYHLTTNGVRLARS